MLKRHVLMLAAALALAGGLFYGVWHLCDLRMTQGDVYPAYSSLRADPLGSKALLEAFDAQPHIEATRNFRPLLRLRPAQPVTLVYAGIARGSLWEEDELREFETLIAAGSRAVFAFSPAATARKPAPSQETHKKPEDDKGKDAGKDTSEKSPKETSRTEEARSKDGADAGAKKEEPDEKAGKPAKKKKKTDDSDEDDASEGAHLISFTEAAKRWGFAFATVEADRRGAFKGKALLQAPDSGLEPEISWHSAMYFSDVQPGWRVLYAVEGRPVIIERTRGDGSLLVSADSYFLSNQALRDERHSRLLAHLAGAPRVIVFDEEHLGVREETGIAALVGKYRLHGAVAALALVALLFIWKSVVRFVPMYSESADPDDAVGGRDSAEGFVHLLRRTIPAAQLTEICVAEWNKAFGHQPREKARVAAALNQAPARQPVQAYRIIAAALEKKN